MVFVLSHLACWAVVLRVNLGWDRGLVIVVVALVEVESRQLCKLDTKTKTKDEKRPLRMKGTDTYQLPPLYQPLIDFIKMEDVVTRQYADLISLRKFR